MTPEHAVEHLGAIVGPRHVIGPGDDQEPYVVDWRGRYRGEALAVVKPADTAEVAKVVRWCARNTVAIVPQGGNTGLCGAAIPSGARPSIILRLDRLNRIRSTSRLGDSIAVDAGCILADVQAAAEKIGRLFPLSLGAEGSCRIGGNLSTNAGGTAVLRYGTMRELTLGLEIVLPDGEILDAMSSLRKDSTGYDLKQMFIGAEGTLGIITGAVLKLFPRPRGRAVAMVKLPAVEAALDLLVLARTKVGERLGSFELLSRSQVDLIAEHMPQVALPFACDAPWFLLIEISDTSDGRDLGSLLETLLTDAAEAGTIIDALIASSETQAETLWKIRHSVSEASKKAGYVVSHDSAVPLEQQAVFVHRVTARMIGIRPDANVVIHGHVGDGNLHVLAVLPGGAPGQGTVDAINRVVDEETAALGGSISAEHGIGVANRDRLMRVTPPLELALMRKIKALLDPQNLMNPGKVLPDLPAPTGTIEQ